MKRLIQFSAQVGIAAALSVVTMSGDVGAVHASYSGTECEFYRDDLDFRWERASTSGINNSVASLIVSCPITNLSPDVTTGITFAAVYVLNPAGETTTCTIYGSSVDGVVQGSQSKSRTSTGWGALYFNGPSGLPSAFSWGSYTMRCVVPAGGRIYTYFIEQP